MKKFLLLYTLGPTLYAGKDEKNRTSTVQKTMCWSLRRNGY
ncbi:MAG TPA: hypothetical protein PKC72_10725 [Chitinophagaceae bacterium]|nr:hypothetical protein [Chitinophagaceae bacterium]